MKVKCVRKKMDDIKSPFARDRLGKSLGSGSNLDSLELGRVYTVYGIVFWDKAPWYYLSSPDEPNYIEPEAGDFFDVVDPRFSKYWHLAFTEDQSGFAESRIVFKEWALDRTFYERFVDDEPDEIALFSKYKKLMDEEFADS